MNPITKIRNGMASDLKAMFRIIRRGRNLGSINSQPPLWTRNMRVLSRRMDEDTAMTITAVYRAVSIIASTISGLPLHVYRDNQFGETEIDETDATAYLWYRPNPEMTRPFFWETVISHEVLNGNAFLFVVKNRVDQPMELWPIHPWRVEVRRVDGQKLYFIDNSREAHIDFSAGGEIVHIPNMSRDGLVGLSPIMLAAQALQLAQEAEAYGARFFADDAVPPGILSTNLELTKEQAIGLRDEWQRQHGGGNRQIAVLSNGATFKEIAINPEDAQLLSERNFQISEIARIFGIPNWMLGDIDHASQGGGNGLEEQWHNFLTLCLSHHILRFESAIEDALLKRRETRRKVHFVTEGLLRANYTTRQEGLQKAVQTYLTVNEARKIEGLPPIEDGDVVLAPMNLAPLGSAAPPATIPRAS